MKNKKALIMKNSSKNDTDKQVLWLLGCGPGIGMSVASRFAREGFSLGLITQDAAPIASTVQELRDTGIDVELGEGDIRNGAWLAACLQAFKQKIGMPTVLVYNASAGVAGPASGLAPGDLSCDLDINLIAPLKVTQYVLPGMKQAKRGTLIFTGGGIALKPQVDLASGSIGKCAIRQLALLLHSELARYGIHAATVTVRGFVQKGGPLDPDDIAERYWELHRQQTPKWDSEICVYSQRA